MTKDLGTRTGSTESELSSRQQLFELFKQCPIPDHELLSNLGVFVSRQAWSRYLYMNHLYSQILNVHGIIIEFGVRWGQNLSIFSNLRGMYEPFNHQRRIVGFDTFEGFPSVKPEDGTMEVARPGGYSTTKGYEEYLQKVLELHEKESPIPHMRKFELVKGDASAQIQGFLDAHPEAIVALAYFDFDLYEPTKVCLEAIKDRLTKGSVVAFDELNYPGWPGETQALREVFGLGRYAIKRTPFNPEPGYIVID